jgi:release factor glutamine methyltransferase
MNLSRAVRALAERGVPDPARDARRLFDWAYAIGQTAPEPQDRDRPNDLTLEMFEIALADRARRRPVSQIVGRRAFWRHEFVVTPDVLDPRPETETLVAAALERPFERVLDLGTGSGCILISLLADRPGAHGLGTDLSEPALAVARRNAGMLGVAERADFLRSDWLAEVDGRFDLIVSNPPYIAEAEMAGLAPEVRDWEPHLALTPGGDGLGAYRAIAAGAGGRLTAGGRIALEIGPTQGEAVSALLKAQGFGAIEVRRDLDGRDRVVVAVKPGQPDGCGAA